MTHQDFIILAFLLIGLIIAVYTAGERIADAYNKPQVYYNVPDSGHAPDGARYYAYIGNRLFFCENEPSVESGKVNLQDIRNDTQVTAWDPQIRIGTIPKKESGSLLGFYVQ